MLLAADIGGTWSRFQAVEAGNIIAAQSYASSAFSSLDAAVCCFRQEHGLPDFSVACLGLPGPVSGRQVQLTNLPWQVDADTLEHQGRIGHVELVNDFQAAAYGVDGLQTDEYIVLHPGNPDPQGHRLVAGAGTGLGVAPVPFCAGRYMPQPCEGGHMDFAPTDDVQQDLLRWLWQQWSHVSYERILSGPGLEVLYGFFAGAQHPQQAATTQASQIVELAAAGDTVATRTLNTFVGLYGSYLGNLALLWPARAGIYIAGGVAAKIVPWMQQPAFLQAMHAKGRMQDVVRSMPVYLVTETGLGLRGAMLRAQEIAYEQTGGH
ncbi:MAG: glucokinase [Thiopseudomonas sp.]|nr:glucokinase [Thiopseudomonas sp.]